MSKTKKLFILIGSLAFVVSLFSWSAEGAQKIATQFLAARQRTTVEQNTALFNALISRKPLDRKKVISHRRSFAEQIDWVINPRIAEELSTRDRFKILMKILFPKMGGRVFDIGTGSGLFLPDIGNWLLNSGFGVNNLDGYDPDPKSEQRHKKVIAASPHLPVHLTTQKTSKIRIESSYDIATINAPFLDNLSGFREMFDLAVNAIKKNGFIWIRLSSNDEFKRGYASILLSEIRKKEKKLPDGWKFDIGFVEMSASFLSGEDPAIDHHEDRWSTEKGNLFVVKIVPIENRDINSREALLSEPEKFPSSFEEFLGIFFQGKSDLSFADLSSSRRGTFGKRLSKILDRLHFTTSRVVLPNTTRCGFGVLMS